LFKVAIELKIVLPRSSEPNFSKNKGDSGIKKVVRTMQIIVSATPTRVT